MARTDEERLKLRLLRKKVVKDARNRRLDFEGHRQLASERVVEETIAFFELLGHVGDATQTMRRTIDGLNAYDRKHPEQVPWSQAFGIPLHKWREMSEHLLQMEEVLGEAIRGMAEGYKSKGVDPMAALGDLIRLREGIPAPEVQKTWKELAVAKVTGLFRRKEKPEAASMAPEPQAPPDQVA